MEDKFFSLLRGKKRRLEKAGKSKKMIREDNIPEVAQLINKTLFSNSNTACGKFRSRIINGTFDGNRTIFYYLGADPKTINQREFEEGAAELRRTFPAMKLLKEGIIDSKTLSNHIRIFIRHDLDEQESFSDMTKKRWIILFYVVLSLASSAYLY